jgi:transcriptional regulator with XRE-family HTH domain
MGRTRNFADVIRAKMAADPALAEAVEEESFNADVAMKVYELRTEAELTQKQLAELIDTQQSVISRIEDADYDGHSLGLLRRIARALGRKLRVEFYACQVPASIVTTTLLLNWSKASDETVSIAARKRFLSDTRTEDWPESAFAQAQPLAS